MVAGAVLIQIALVVTGASVLITTGPRPDLPTRLVRFFGYFTIQSNLLVLLTSCALVAAPGWDGRFWRVLRLDAILGITVTGLIHWFFLRPILHLTGWSAFTDTLLHVVVPLLAVIGWVVFGPRQRTSPRLLLLAMVWPLVYMVGCVVFGARTGWYPYPFTDVNLHGYGAVLVNGVGVVVLLLLVGGLLVFLDRRLATVRFRSKRT